MQPEDVSAGRDGNYGATKIDTAAVDYGTGAIGLDDLIFRRTNLPPDEFSAGRNGDYIWCDLWTGPSVCNRSVTRSLSLGSPHRLGRCCLWLAALPFRWIGSAEFPLSHHLLPAVGRRTSHEGDMPFHSHLCQVHPRDSEMDFLLPFFRLILTFSYCLYDFLREQELETGRSPTLFTDRLDGQN